MTDDKKHLGVIVTQPGETIKETDPRVRPELIERVPQHDWRSKAFELVELATRRRAIIRRLVKANRPLKRK